MSNRIRLYFNIFKNLITDIIYPDSYVLLYAKSLESNNNFGDDIGEVIVSFLTKKKLLQYRGAYISRFLRKKPNYLIVGSIIPQFTKPNTIIWGSGVGESTHILSNKPLKVLAVRGPLTRQYLIERGVDCPDVYGDPALLLSKYYAPNKEKKYKFGLIPHFLDQNEEFFQYMQKLGDDVIFINVRKYGTWKNFIDQVCSCEFVFSSSLHGLIIADAFGIPNIWCQFSHKMEDDGFKFRDYLMSVNKHNLRPVEIMDKDRDDLDVLKTMAEKPTINLDNMLSVCPFK
ncbi:polysaccharide pyruvyl transferase family protein [Marseilla massiliensis]|uniref:Polysaccharide pyruvyl transferase family protein n=1 Tax=Marseilla massiliensis TaxID=1841864 RepID=A0A938WPN0_9BACT|nr:polysaccharide pyruvyl transferase family protein [Marseilla massiliensis]MBM6662069.1 polysaccharide pyruvyl transferase family protein [Marseilla massiliensis]